MALSQRAAAARRPQAPRQHDRRVAAVAAHLTAGSETTAPATGGSASYASWTAQASTIRVPFDALKAEFTRVLVEAGLASERAALVGKLIAENQLDGVYSHGLNRFPKVR